MTFPVSPTLIPVPIFSNIHFPPVSSVFDQALNGVVFALASPSLLLIAEPNQLLAVAADESV